jgi:prophage regulatory protein
MLMGAAKIRQRLGGISRQRVYQLTQRPDWPMPYDELVQPRPTRRYQSAADGSETLYQLS